MPDNDEPFRLFATRDSSLAGSRSSPQGNRTRVLPISFGVRWLMKIELAAPFHGDDLPFRDIGDIDFSEGSGQCCRVGAHLSISGPRHETGRSDGPFAPVATNRTVPRVGSSAIVLAGHYDLELGHLFRDYRDVC